MKHPLHLACLSHHTICCGRTSRPFRGFRPRSVGHAVTTALGPSLRARSRNDSRSATSRRCRGEKCRLVLLISVAGIVASSVNPATAYAQSNVTEQAWHNGVSPENEQKARALFAQAGQLQERFLYEQARATYQKALASWDNPFIHIELAWVLLKLGHALRAYEHLQEAQKWGPNSLPEPDQKRIRALEQTLLKQHLAVIEVRCDEPGAEVALDGKTLFIGPGVKRTVVRPDLHVLTAKKPGYFPLLESIALLAGKPQRALLTLSEDRIFETRKWARWKPWTVAVAGAATVLLGAGLKWRAGVNIIRGDRALNASCAERPACSPSDSIHYARARLAKPVGDRFVRHRWRRSGNRPDHGLARPSAHESQQRSQQPAHPERAHCMA